MSTVAPAKSAQQTQVFAFSCRADITTVLRAKGPCSRTRLHKLLGITDSEDDRKRVWRLAQWCHEMKEVKTDYHRGTGEPVYSLV